MARQWMTTREAAEAGVVVGADTERKVRDLCASGRLGHHLVGRTYLHHRRPGVGLQPHHPSTRQEHTMTAATLTEAVKAYTEARERWLACADVAHLAGFEAVADELGADLLRRIAQEVRLDKADPWRTEKECPECNGRGLVVGASRPMPCPDCGSRGVVTDEPGARVVDAVREVQAA